jgi:two-component system cell cycle response regulator DivK
MNKDILVVEDNQQNLELVEFLLEDAGFDVRSARDADEMRSEIAAGLPTLVLMDIQLPGIDGLVLVAEIRQRAEADAMPIVALTAHAMRGDRERFLAAGCDGYISKPIDISTFADEVKRYLS